MAKIRVLYDAGPGDAFRTLDDWGRGSAPEKDSHITYSSQFYNAVRSVGGSAEVLCSFPGGRPATANEISITPCPDLFSGRSGVGYHLTHFAQARRIIEHATAFRANVVVFNETTLPGLLAPLHKRGVHMVQVLHCRLWTGEGPTPLQQLVLRSSRSFYKKRAKAVLSVSNRITREIEQIAGGEARSTIECFPSYTSEYFGGMQAVNCNVERLEIAFVGRVEVSKGCLDLVEIADRLKARGESVLFHVCGDGTGLAHLRDAVEARNLDQCFELHGWCDRSALRSVIERCQLGIIPTKSTFPEGFNQAAVELILAGRPVLISTACPAAEYLAPAGQPIQVDQIEDYVRAVSHLVHDRGDLMRRVNACRGVAEPFLSGVYSFESALKDVFGAVLADRDVVARKIPLTAECG